MKHLMSYETMLAKKLKCTNMDFGLHMHDFIGMIYAQTRWFKEIKLKILA